MDIVSDMKNSPSGSNLCAASASPVCDRKSKRPSGENNAIQEEGTHEVSVHEVSIQSIAEPQVIKYSVIAL